MNTSPASGERPEQPAVTGPFIPVTVHVDPEASGIGNQVTHERTDDEAE